MSHQFLQQKNSEQFGMVLVNKPKRLKTDTINLPQKNKNGRQATRTPPIEFKPLITSTPKRNERTLETVNKTKVRLGPRRRWSQLIDVLPCSKNLKKMQKPPDKQITVKLKNFLSHTPNITIVVDDFTDDKEYQPVTPSTTWTQLNGQQNGRRNAQRKSVAQTKMNETFIKPKSSFNYTSKGAARELESFKKTKKFILREESPNGTFANFENIVKKQSVCDTTCLAFDDSMRSTLENVFKDAFNKKIVTTPKILKSSSARISKLKGSVKLAKVYNQPKQGIKYLTNESLFNVLEQKECVQDFNLKELLFDTYENTNSDFLLNKNVL